MTLPGLRLCAILLLTWSLAAGAAAGAGPSLRAELDVASLLATEGHLSGEVIAFLQEQNGFGDGGANPKFTIQASSIRVEVDEADPYVHGGLVAYAPNPVSLPPTTHAEAVVEGHSNAEGYRWNIFPLEGSTPPRVEAMADCAKVVPPAATRIERAPMVRLERGSVMHDASRSMEWIDCGSGSRVTVRGDFVLSLWEWDATLTANGSTHDIESGRSPTRSLPDGSPDLSAFVSKDRQAFLFVTDGLLTVPLLTGGGQALYFGSDSRLAATGMRLEGASGELDVGPRHMELDAGSLDFDGVSDSTLSGAGAGRPLHLSLTAQPRHLAVNGHAVSVPESGRAFPWGWTVLATVGTGAAVAVPVLRQRRGAGDADAFLGNIYDLIFAHRFDEARAEARRLVRIHANLAEARFVHAWALGGLGRWAEALREHQAAESRLRVDDDGEFRVLRGQNAFEAARACLNLAPADPQQRAHALGWLRLAIHCQDVYHAQASNDPLLASLLPGQGDWKDA